MLFKRINVQTNERVIITRNGRFVSILAPGTYRFMTWSTLSLGTESHNLSQVAFRSRWQDYLLNKRRDLVAEHFILVETSESEIALIYLEGSLYQVLLPGKSALFWKNAARVSTELVSIIDPELPELAPLERPEYEAEVDYLLSEP